MTTTNTYGRQVVVPLTNKSGGSVAAGDVVIVDTANNDAFTTTTSGGSTASIGVAQETIANNAVGRILLSGYAALINVNASVTRGNYGKTHTVAKQATDAGASRVAGTFCQFLTGGTTPDAVVYPSDLGSGSGTGTLTTIKDEGSNLSTAVVSIDFVGAGVTATGTTAVTVTIPGTGVFVGAKAYATSTQNTSGGTAAALTLDSEEFDTDGFHSTSSNTSRMTIPSGKGGKYRISGASFASGAADWIILKLNGTTFIRGGGQNVPSAGRWTVTTIQDLSVGDYVELFASSTPSVNWGHATNPDAQTTLSVEFLG